MSKDNINPKRYILTEEEIVERDRKVVAACAKQVEHAFKTHNTWQAIAMDVNLHTEPVPLPNPVEIPDISSYDKYYKTENYEKLKQIFKQ